MRQLTLAVILLIALAAAADLVLVSRWRAEAWQAGSVMLALALLLAACVALTNGAWVKELRRRVEHSLALATALPVLLLAPYAILGLGTHTFSVQHALRLAAYVWAPTLLLLPDRHRAHQRAGWRDFAAMAALSAPIPAGWLTGVYHWPIELYFLIPFTAIPAGAYAFMVVRGLEDVGYRLAWRRQDLTIGVSAFVLFTVLAIPLGYALHFIRFHSAGVTWSRFAIQFVGIYLTVAVPEELLFRGFLQNLLEKTIRRGPPGRYGLILASLIFGASHFHHPPVPNWRYCILATLAGLFYGGAYQTRRRISASALTHALVDTLWHFWF